MQTHSTLVRLTWNVGALLSIATLDAGCVTVQPYERGRLAAPDMELDPAADLVAASEHATEYREGAVGGIGGGGGGCGCN